jgi:hypothetical protein
MKAGGLPDLLHTLIYTWRLTVNKGNNKITELRTIPPCVGQGMLRILLYLVTHCQPPCVGQGMKQIWLYLWFPLFQASMCRSGYEADLAVFALTYTLRIEIK